MPKKNNGVREFPCVNMRLRPKTHEKLKLASSLLDITMIEVVSNAIDKYLENIDYDKLYQERLNKID